MRSPLLVMSQQYDIEANKLVDVLRGTVIKPDRSGRHATNEEVAAFTIVANRYKLNPFTREIHAFTDPQRGVVPIIGIDGWSRIINSHEQFDGCDFIDEEGKDGNPISITCVMHVKGRSHPISIKERFKECFRDTKPWNGMPWRMLRHKALMQAGRIAFSISGLFDEDEARDIVEGTATSPSQPVESSTTTIVKKLKSRELPAPKVEESQQEEFIEHEPEMPQRPAPTNAITEDPRDAVPEAAQNPVESEQPVIDVSTWTKFFVFMTEQAAGKIDPAIFEHAMKTLKLGDAGSGKTAGTKKRLDIVDAVIAGQFSWETASITE